MWIVEVGRVLEDYLVVGINICALDGREPQTRALTNRKARFALIVGSKLPEALFIQNQSTRLAQPSDGICTLALGFRPVSGKFSRKRT